MAVLIKICFVFTGVNWFSIKLQNGIIKRIHFIKCGGRPLVRGGYNQMYFLFYRSMDLQLGVRLMSSSLSNYFKRAL